MQNGLHIFKSLQKSAIAQPTAVAMVAKVSVILIHLVMDWLEVLRNPGSHVLCVEFLVFAPCYRQGTG
jgi:hypothetical protein